MLRSSCGIEAHQCDARSSMEKHGDTLEEGEDLITDVDDEEANKSNITRIRLRKGWSKNVFLIFCLSLFILEKTEKL